MSGSKDAEPSNVIAVPTAPLYGPFASAVGASLTSVTVALVAAVSLPPLPSLTVSETVNVLPQL